VLSSRHASHRLTLRDRLSRVDRHLRTTLPRLSLLLRPHPQHTAPESLPLHDRHRLSNRRCSISTAPPPPPCAGRRSRPPGPTSPAPSATPPATTRWARPPPPGSRTPGPAPRPCSGRAAATSSSPP